MSRIETREHAAEFLFQIGFRDDPVSEQLDLFREHVLIRKAEEAGYTLENIEEFKASQPVIIDDEPYFLDIVYGVINNRNELDEKFVPFLKRWKLERLPMTDRIILEIAVYEILSVDEIPTSVSINEAVKLAKKFGTASSSSYINGILSNFVKSL